MREGWGFPYGAKVSHYFRDTMSLCRRYGFYQAELIDSGKTMPTDDKNHCRECNKRLIAEQRKESR